MDVTLIELVQRWGDMDTAALRILTAQPHQMTEGAKRLDETRLVMRDAVNAMTRSALTTT